MEQKEKEKTSYSPTIYTKENIIKLKSIPVLDDGQVNIYVILNSPQGNIKIGKTTNIIQRLTSLSGSNGGSNKISKIYVSPPTYLQTMEGTCHSHYHFARIPGTEWFDGNKVDFNEVVGYVDGLFRTSGYKLCNEVRRKFIEEEKERLSKRKINKDDNKGN